MYYIGLVLSTRFAVNHLKHMQFILIIISGAKWRKLIKKWWVHRFSSNLEWKVSHPIQAFTAKMIDFPLRFISLWILYMKMAFLVSVYTVYIRLPVTLALLGYTTHCCVGIGNSGNGNQMWNQRWWRRNGYDETVG